jgi:hypothetical protein
LGVAEAIAFTKWDERIGGSLLHLHTKFTGEGLMLYAWTILAKMAQDERFCPRLAPDYESRAMGCYSRQFMGRLSLPTCSIKFAVRTNFGTKAKRRSRIFIWH